MNERGRCVFCGRGLPSGGFDWQTDWSRVETNNQKDAPCCPECKRAYACGYEQGARGQSEVNGELRARVKKLVKEADNANVVAHAASEHARTADARELEAAESARVAHAMLVEEGAKRRKAEAAREQAEYAYAAIASGRATFEPDAPHLTWRWNPRKNRYCFTCANSNKHTGHACTLKCDHEVNAWTPCPERSCPTCHFFGEGQWCTLTGCHDFDGWQGRHDRRTWDTVGEDEPSPCGRRTCATCYWGKLWTHTGHPTACDSCAWPELAQWEPNMRLRAQHAEARVEELTAEMEAEDKRASDLYVETAKRRDEYKARVAFLEGLLRSHPQVKSSIVISGESATAGPKEYAAARARVTAWETGVWDYLHELRRRAGLDQPEPAIAHIRADKGGHFTATQDEHGRVTILRPTDQPAPATPPAQVLTDCIATYVCVECGRAVPESDLVAPAGSRYAQGARICRSCARTPQSPAPRIWRCEKCNTVVAEREESHWLKVNGEIVPCSGRLIPGTFTPEEDAK